MKLRLELDVPAGIDPTDPVQVMQWLALSFVFTRESTVKAVLEAVESLKREAAAPPAPPPTQGQGCSEDWLLTMPDSDRLPVDSEDS